MAPDPAEESFKVTDRRRRTDTEPARAAGGAVGSGPGSAKPTPAQPEPAGSLAGLFVMLASSALVALGESPNPLTGQVQRDLAHAREAIDVLRVLREKTEGNRTPEETQLLGQLIYDLQLRFVRATGSPSG